MDEYRALDLPAEWIVRVGPLTKAAGALNWFLKEFPARRVYGFVGDDCVLKTKGWDRRLSEAAGDWNIAYPDDGLHGEKLCTHFCIGGKLAAYVGWLALPGLDHNYVDTAWMAVGKVCGNLVYCEDVKFDHRHPLAEKAPDDPVYERGREKYERDRELFRRWVKSPRFQKLTRTVKNMVHCRDSTKYQEMRDIKVAICIPSARMWEPDFGRCFGALVWHFASHYVEGTRSQVLNFLTNRGSQISYGRERLMANALKAEATHILWLDDDMTFPPDTLQRLLAHDKDFVAAQGVTKKVPAEPTAMALDGNRCFSDKSKTGLEEIIHVGLAVALMKTDRLHALRAPNFLQEWSEEHQGYGGEDTYFCRKLRRELGVKIYLDHDLSREVGHVGTLVYDHTLVGTVERKEVHAA